MGRVATLGIRIRHSRYVRTEESVGDEGFSIVDTPQMPVSLNVFGPRGLWSSLVVTYVNQHGRFNDENFALVDGASRFRVVSAALVFAAGDWETKFSTSIINPLANDPRTIAVTNCWIDKNGVERLYDGELSTATNKSTIGDKVDVCADGEQAETLLSLCSPLDLHDGSCPGSGSSAATATVTGVLALVLTANPGLKWEQVRDLLGNTAFMVDATESDADGKWFQGRSKWYGRGRIDAGKAVREALRPPSP